MEPIGGIIIKRVRNSPGDKAAAISEVRIFKPLNLHKPQDHTFSERFKQYGANVLLLFCAFLLYRTNKFYSQGLDPKAMLILEIYMASYIVIGFFAYAFFVKNLRNETKGYVLLRAIEKFTRQSVKYLKEFVMNPQCPSPKLNKEEKNTLLFLLVKLFYLPVMANFCIMNFNGIIEYSTKITGADVKSYTGISAFNDLVYPLLFNIILFIDTLYFTFGYMFEAGFLRNRIRSVEPTVLGWAVALLCYPPFNGFLGNYVSWYATDFPSGNDATGTLVLRIITLLLFGIYLWATLALGTRSSNLTNRGIVTHGPYRFVRHPAYISKNLAWWLSMLPVLSFTAILNMAFWSFLYFMRAITEERHLIQDPDYRQYCAKVRFRFIPRIW